MTRFEARARRLDAVPPGIALLSVLGVAGWLLWADGTGLRAAFSGGAVALAAAAYTCGRVAARRGAPDLVRRFWRRFCQSAVCLAVGACSTAVLASNDPGLSPFIGGPALLGVVLAVTAFLRLPIGRRTSLSRAQLLLDGATVALAGALIFWYVVRSPAGDANASIFHLVAAVFGVGGVLAVVVLGKAALTPHGPVDSLSLRLLTIAPLVGVAVPVVLIAGGDQPRLALAVLGMPLVGAAFSAAAYRQLRVLDRPDAAPAPVPARSLFNLLPLLAIAATTGLVVTVSAQQMSWHQRTVIIGAVLIAGCVVLRQLLGLRENARQLRGITAQRAELELLAMTDPLTGLASRARFGAVLTDRLAAGEPASVLLIDLDDFKMVNDVMGHAVGDRLLTELAARLRRHSGPDDLPARLGGDEFA
ncbi:MAG TPA: GGDEF domain-containing protein, partial [Nocardioides sp.]|nr:GGDEF domain-containing protein [Nocardioides sp.]